MRQSERKAGALTWLLGQDCEPFPSNGKPTCDCPGIAALISMDDKCTRVPITVSLSVVLFGRDCTALSIFGVIEDMCHGSHIPNTVSSWLA